MSRQNLHKSRRERELGIAKAVIYAPPEILLALMLGPDIVMEKSRITLIARIREATIPTWLIDNTLDYLLPFGNKEIEKLINFWELFKAAGYCMKIKHLVEFVSIFGKMKENSENYHRRYLYFDEAITQLKKHKDVNAYHIHGIIKRLPEKRSELLKLFNEIATPIMVLIDCLQFANVKYAVADKLTDAQPDDSFEPEKAAKIMSDCLVKYRDRDLKKQIFQLMNDWDLLSEKQLWQMEKLPGVKQLVRAELKSREITLF